MDKSFNIGDRVRVIGTHASSKYRKQDLLPHDIGSTGVVTMIFGGHLPIGVVFDGDSPTAGGYCFDPSELERR